MGGLVPVLPGDDKESNSLTPKVKDSGDQDRNFGVNFADFEPSEDFPDFSAVEEWFDNLSPGSLEFWSSMGGDCELGLAGNGVSVKVEESEGEKTESLCGGGAVPVKVEESGGEKIGALCVGGGVVVKVEECEVGDVGVIGGGIGGRGEGVNDAETFVEREMGRVSLDCRDDELGCGGGDGIGGGTEAGKMIFGTGKGVLDAIDGEGVYVKTELDVDDGVVCNRDVVVGDGGVCVKTELDVDDGVVCDREVVVGGDAVCVKTELDVDDGVVCDREVVMGGDAVCVKTELASEDGEMADDSFVIGGDSFVIGGAVMESNETLGDGQQACEDVQGKDTREGERGSSSDELSSSSSTSDDNSDEENEADDEVDGTETKQGGVKADEEMDEMEEGEIREADEQAMPAKKDFTESEEDGDDADKMIDWCSVENETGGFEGFSDDENEVIAGPIMSKNEHKVLPPVPSVCVKLESHHEMVPIGPVLSIVELQVVVEGCLKHNPLSEGSILWIAESRSPLGFVEEIFGPVKSPFYLIRYNSKAEIPAGVKEGTLVSSVPEYASYVLNQKDLHKKGYDLSGRNDEEVSEDEEFSDDEKEAEYKRMQRMAKRDTGMNAEKPVNRKARKMKDSGRNSNWKPRPFTQPVPTTPSRVQLNINQDHPPTKPAPTDCGNIASSSGIRPGFFGGNNEVPPFPLPMPDDGNSVLPFNPSLLSGLPLQGPTGAGLLNAISNALLLQANNGQFPAQTAQFPVQTAHQFPSQPMVPPNQVPFQLGYNPSQNVLANLVPPGVQSNPFGDPASAPWSGPIPQNSFNPAGVGMSPGGQLDPNNLLLFANALGILLSGGQNDQNFNAMAPSPVAAPPATAAMPPSMQSFGQFNPGSSSGPGHRPFRRGGGRFSGGRGRGRFH